MKLLGKKHIFLGNVLDFILFFLKPLIYLKIRLRNFLSFSYSDSIAIIDLHLLGDLVITASLLRAVRKSHPTSNIILIAGKWAEILYRQQDLYDIFVPCSVYWVDRSVGVLSTIYSTLSTIKQLRDLKVKTIIDVRGDFRNILIAFFSGAHSIIGFKFGGGGALLTQTVGDDGELKHLFTHHMNLFNSIAGTKDGFEPPYFKKSKSDEINLKNSKMLLGIHFGASRQIRELPDDLHFELLSLITQIWPNKIRYYMDPSHPTDRSKLHFFLESRHAELWSGSLREFIDSLSDLDMLICLDSGPAHIATALNIKTLVIYGPNLSKYVSPVGVNVDFIEPHSQHECRPCRVSKCNFNKICYYDSVRQNMDKIRNFLLFEKAKND